MAELEKLLKRLRSADKKGDRDKLDIVRAKIIEQYPDSKAAPEAMYRLGLSKLLRHKDPDGAAELFRQAAASDDALYAPMARISFALVLHAQKKEQKALFELRKVVGSRKPTIQSAMALAFIVTILGDMGAKVSEVQRARAQQIEHLRALVDEYRDSDELPSLKMQLGLALFDQKEYGEAAKILNELLKIDGLDDEIADAAKTALKAIR